MTDKIDFKNGIKSCYLLYGEDTLFRKNTEEKIKKKVIDEAAEMMNMTVFNDAKTTAGDIIEAAETFPFLSDKRFILVKDCGFFTEGKKAESDLLADYIPNITDTACIVFSEEKADKRLKLYKAVEKAGDVASFNGMKEAELVNFMEKKFAKNRVKASKAVCVYLVRNSGGDAELLKRESDKLLAYADGKAEITVEDIDAVCVKSSEAKVFDLVAFMIDGKNGRAIEIYRNLLMVNESPFMVLSLITRQFRIILKCKSLSESGAGMAEIVQRTGLKEFVVRGALRHGQRFSFEMLEAALDKCLKTDYMIKSGKLDASTAVEMIIASGAF